MLRAPQSYKIVKQERERPIAIRSDRAVYPKGEPLRQRARIARCTGLRMQMNLEAISHYRILDKLGAGGMGEVYLAQDTRLDGKVALKLLPAACTQDAACVRRFAQAKMD